MLIRASRIRRVWKWLGRNAGTISTIVAAAALCFTVYTILRDTKVREQEQYLRAWAVIREAYGFRMSGARNYALEWLNERGESLIGVDLSGSYLHGIKLPEAQLDDAVLVSAVFDSADLQKAVMIRVNITSAKFRFARMNGSNLNGAFTERYEYSDIDFRCADLRESYLTDIKEIDRADFRGADLRGAYLWDSSPFLRRGRVRVPFAVHANIHGVVGDSTLIAGLLEKGAVQIADDETWQRYRDLHMQEIMSPPQ